MADNVAKGDDEIKNPVAEAADNLSTQVSNSFLDEIRNEPRPSSGSDTDKSGSNSRGPFEDIRKPDLSGDNTGKGDSKPRPDGDIIKQIPNGDKGPIPNGDKGQIPNGDRQTEKSGEKNNLPEIFKHLLKKDGVTELKTGDYLVRKDGNETLFTPGGDSVTVNKDGSLEVKGDVKEVKTDKNGETTITFKDGSTVKADKEGIKSVSRNGQTESFPRFNQKGNDTRPEPRPLPEPKPRPLPHPGGDTQTKPPVIIRDYKHGGGKTLPDVQIDN